MTLQSSTDGIIQKCISLYIFELRVFQWKNSLLLNSPDILSVTSLTFRQTRYQALYKDVQRLIADTASIAVRKRPSLYMYASSPYRRNWLWGKIMFYPNIFITLPLPIIFPSLIFFQIIFPIIRIQILYFTTYIIRYRCSPIINSLSFKFFYNVHLFFVFR